MPIFLCNETSFSISYVQYVRFRFQFGRNSSAASLLDTFREAAADHGWQELKRAALSPAERPKFFLTGQFVGELGKNVAMADPGFAPATKPKPL